MWVTRLAPRRPPPCLSRSALPHRRPQPPPFASPRTTRPSRRPSTSRPTATPCSSRREPMSSCSAAAIRDNVISGNAPSGCSGGPGGGGIQVVGADTEGNLQILGNTITGNLSGADGGGISLFAAGAATVAGNLINGNSTQPHAAGGGIWIVNGSGALITNNIVFGTDATAVLFCGDFNDPNPPRIAFNDVVSTAGPEYGGICPDQTGQNGNISADPLFVSPAAGNYHVWAGSPVVDAGRDAGAPATDFDGAPRPLDGNGDGTPVVDIGADEVAGGDTTPPTITCAADPATLRPPDHTCTGSAWTSPPPMTPARPPTPWCRSPAASATATSAPATPPTTSK